MEHINSNPEFKAVDEPLRDIGLELSQNRQSLEKIHSELLQLRTNVEGKTDWSNYLNQNTMPDVRTRRSTLRDEADRIEARQRTLENAANEGRLQRDAVRNRLSREPCKQARPLIVVQIKKILGALDEIDQANTAIRALRDTIENQGYRASALPPAELNLAGHDDAYRIYLRHHFPEVI